MKKKILSLVLALSMVMSLMIPSVFASYDGFLELSRGAVDVSVDSSFTLSATTHLSIEDDDVYFQWSSSDSSVARISGRSSGKGLTSVDVVARSGGDCEITCYASFESEDGGNSDSATCSVHVEGGSGGGTITSVSISPSRVTLYDGRGGDSSCDVSANVRTSGDVSYNDIEYSWESSNSSIARVSGGNSSSATISAVSSGSCYVTCKVYYGNQVEEASCSVNVMGGSSGGINSVSIDSDATVYISGGSSTYGIGATVSTYGDVDSSDLDYYWSSSNSSKATVSGSGSAATIYARSRGTCYVTCTVTYKGQSVSSNKCLVTVIDNKPEVPPAPSIVSNLPSSYTATYGVSDYISIEGYSSYNSLRYEWYVDGRYDSYTTGRNNQSVSFNTRNLSVGSHSVYCNVQAYYNGYYSDVTRSRTCTVKVTDSGSFYISSDLPSSYTTTYGNSNTISFNLKNTTSYGEKYQWYVDGKKDSSSSSNSFNTKYLSVGTHKVYCNAYTSKGNYDVTTRTCTVTVNQQYVPSTGSMNNFKVRYSYNNRFVDVYSSNWFYSYVKTAYEYGLVNGKNSANTFCPFDNFTVAEALKVAACINSIYYTGSENALTNGYSSPYWYSIYVNYCISQGIINQGDFYDYNANCTRAQMAYIFSRCLPASELYAVRNVNIPDCNNTSTQYYSNIQTLYNAGVVSGDATHCYYPTQYIKRSEVAKIVCTLTAPSTRDRTVF